MSVTNGLGARTGDHCGVMIGGRMVGVQYCKDFIAGHPVLNGISKSVGVTQLISVLRVSQVAVPDDVVRTGDVLEQYLSPLTGKHLSHWWRFRDLIRAGGFLVREGGLPASDAGKKAFAKLGMLGHHVVSCLACSLEDIAEAALWINRADRPLSDDGRLDGYFFEHCNALRHLDWRRHLRSASEHLYSTFTGLAATYGAVFDGFNSLDHPPGLSELRLDEVEWSDGARAVRLLSSVQDAFHVRTQEAHYWTLPMGIQEWMGVESLAIPEGIQKGTMNDDYGEEDFRSVLSVFVPFIEATVIALNFAYFGLSNCVDRALSKHGYVVERVSRDFIEQPPSFHDLMGDVTTRVDLGRSRARAMQQGLRLLSLERKTRS